MSKRTYYLKRAKEIAQTLGNHYRAKKVYLFGSTVWNARGAPNDIDLLIIASSLPKRGVDRIRDAQKRFEHDVAVDTILYTPSEFTMAIRSGDPFIKKITRQGMALYA